MRWAACRRTREARVECGTIGCGGGWAAFTIRSVRVSQPSAVATRGYEHRSVVDSKLRAGLMLYRGHTQDEVSIEEEAELQLCEAGGYVCRRPAHAA